MSASRAMASTSRMMSPCNLSLLPENCLRAMSACLKKQGKQSICVRIIAFFSVSSPLSQLLQTCAVCVQAVCQLISCLFGTESEPPAVRHFLRLLFQLTSLQPVSREASARYSGGHQFHSKKKSRSEHQSLVIYRWIPSYRYYAIVEQLRITIMKSYRT